MEMEILEASIKHISKFMRTIVGSEKVILTLDGHASRNGVGWIEECLPQNIEAVIAPANTSHFLQPCDQFVNKGYKENGRALRDNFCSQGRFDTRKVNFNLACGVYSFECITLSDAIRSFEECGLFPFQRDFATRFRSAVDNVKDRAESQADSIRTAGIASRLPSFVQRKSDKSTYEELKSIFQSSSGPSSALQGIAVVLKSAETVNAILMSVDSSEKENNSPTQVSGNLPNVLHDAGAPAECLTLREVFEKRKEALVAKELEAAEKERRKQAEEIERSRKKAEQEAHRKEVSMARAQKRAQAAALKELAASERAAKQQRKTATAIYRKKMQIIVKQNRKEDRERNKQSCETMLSD